jgi:glycine/serine hydroxymethyltransferase
MGPDEMRQIAALIARVLDNREDEQALSAVANDVRELASGFPVPGITDRAQVKA